MEKTILKNGTIITMDEGHKIYDKGYIVIEDDKIKKIGSMDEYLENEEGAKVIDAKNCAVLPGLIDTHGHGGHCLTKTLGEHLEDGWEPMAEEIYFKYSDEEFWRADAALAAAERIKFGVTTGVSMPGNTSRIGDMDIIEAHIEGTLSTGIRHITGVGCPNPPWNKTARKWFGKNDYKEYEVTPETAFEFVPKAMKKFVGKYDMCDFIVMPSRMGRNTENDDELNIRQNKAMLKLAQEYDTVIHAHSYKGDMNFLMSTSPEVFERRMFLAHCTGMYEEEFPIMAKNKITVCHGPSTNANASVRCPIVEMMREGVNVVIATDGTAPDRSFDLLKDLKVAKFIHHGFFHSGGILQEGKLLEMITNKAALAVGKEKEIGSLEVGKKADIIVINGNQPHLAPWGIMPVERIVNHATGSDVIHTIIDGKIVMENRKLLIVDEQKIIDQANLAFEKMCERSKVLEYAVKNKDLWSVK